MSRERIAVPRQEPALVPPNKLMPMFALMLGEVNRRKLVATINFPWWKRWLWRILRRPTMRKMPNNWHPQQFEWADDDELEHHEKEGAP